MLQYHVINLRSRVDRLVLIRDRLSHPYRIQAAVSPRALAGAAGERVRRFDSWVDPLLHRPINDAEVACFLSHFALWEQCAQGADSFVILEDDVATTPDWSAERIEGPLRDAPGAGPSIDLLYLTYREMGRAQPLTPDLVRPHYPYWSCAYALTPAGARKLLAAAPLSSGVIPVDEFLATMIGYRHAPPNEPVNEVYRDASPLTAAALRRPIYRAESRHVLGSDIEGPRVRPNVVVATVATDYERADVLLESTLRNEIPAVAVLGVGDQWKSGDPARGESGWDKLALMQTFLAAQRRSGRLRSSDILLFVDGYDTFIHGDLGGIRDRFLESGCHVLFAAEKSCWPRRNRARHWGECATEYRYLNSGAYIGYVGAIEELLTHWDAATDHDDQQFFIDRYLSGTPPLDLRLDHACALFQCLEGVEPGELDLTGGALRNTRTASYPSVVHGNGPAKTTFAALATALDYRGSVVKTFATLRRRASEQRRRASADDGAPSITYIGNPGGAFTLHGPEILLVEFMTPRACADLIAFAEARGTWTSLPGDRFPAQEIRLRALSPRLFLELEEAWKRNVDPVVERYWAPLRMYGLRDAFLVRYSLDTQRALALHNDASLVTGCVGLNNGYEGGRLVWPRQGVTNAAIPIGTLALFPGQVTHGHRVEAVTSGIKYSLVIWSSRFTGDLNY